MGKRSQPGPPPPPAVPIMFALGFQFRLVIGQRATLQGGDVSVTLRKLSTSSAHWGTGERGDEYEAELQVRVGAQTKEFDFSWYERSETIDQTLKLAGYTLLVRERVAEGLVIELSRMATATEPPGARGGKAVGILAAARDASPAEADMQPRISRVAPGLEAPKTMAAQRYLQRKSQLQAVSLTEVEAVSAEELASCPALASLRGLDISRAGNFRERDLPEFETRRFEGVGDEIAVALARSVHLTRLRSLAIRDSDAGDVAATALADAAHLTSLEALDLTACEVTSNGIAKLLSSERLPRLRWLGLSYAGVAVKPQAHGELSRLPGMSRLQHLDIGGRNLGDGFLVAFLQSKNVEQLETLVLDCNHLAAAGMTALASCPHLGRLRYLSLFENFIGDAGAIALAESWSLPNVVYLDLGVTRIGAAGGSTLASCPGLESLRALVIDESTAFDSPGLGDAVAELKERFGARVCFDSRGTTGRSWRGRRSGGE